MYTPMSIKSRFFVLGFWLPMQAYAGWVRLRRTLIPHERTAKKAETREWSQPSSPAAVRLSLCQGASKQTAGMSFQRQVAMQKGLASDKSDFKSSEGLPFYTNFIIDDKSSTAGCLTLIIKSASSHLSWGQQQKVNSPCTFHMSA